MTKRRKKKRKAIFWKIYRVYVLLLVVAIVITGIVVGVKLKKYQAGIDEAKAIEEEALKESRAPQVAFETFISTLDEEGWLKLYKEHYSNATDTDENVRAFIKEHLSDGAISKYKGKDYKESEPSFEVYSDDRLLATFYMSGGNGSWQVSSASMHDWGDINATAKVPVGATLFNNGNAVDMACVLTSDEIIYDGPYKDRLNNPVTFDTYEVEHLLSEPSFSVSMPEGADEGRSSVLDTPEIINNASVFYPELSETAAADFSSRAKNFVSALLYYYNMGKNNTGGNMNAALGHVASGSEASKIISNSYDGITWRTPETKSYTLTTSPVSVVADNCYMIDVDYVADGDDANNAYRVYFIDLGYGYKIYDFALK